MAKIPIAGLTLLAATLGVSVPACGRPQQTTAHKSDSELTDIKGTVRSEDGKITFVADEGGRSWDVTNPDVLKDSIDQHLKLSAHLYPDKNQIHVVTLEKL
jgi:hypothetical protein